MSNGAHYPKFNPMNHSSAEVVVRNPVKRGGSFYRRFVAALYLLILVLCIALKVSAQPGKNILEKQVTLSFTRGSIQDFLGELAEHHGIHFSYDPGIIPPGIQVGLESQDQSVGQVLSRLFWETDIKYSVREDLIILSKRKKYTVSGFVEDRETGESLIGATVLETVSNVGTVSNNYGFYSLTIPEGERVIQVSFVGYGTESFSLILKKDTVLMFRLVPGMEIKEVSITAGSLKRDLESSAISVEKISRKSIERFPTLLGEGDVLRTIEFLPGVQLGSEASSGISVRGGSPEQNLILLDGAPVYNSNHAFGLFSVFNPDAIKQVSMIKGGFPARYGGRLSSVIDVRMNEGSPKGFHGNFYVGTISSKFTLEGPIWKDRSSFIVSARRTYIDLLLPNKFEEDEDIPSFYFYDINAKINFRVSERNRLFLSLYQGHDRFTEKERYTSEDGYYTDNENILGSWGNLTFLARWNHVYNNKLFSNLSAIYSEYGLKIDVNEEEFTGQDYKYQAVIYNSGIEDLSMKVDFDYYPATGHSVKFGADYLYHTFNPGVFRRILEEINVVNSQTVESPANTDETDRNDLIYANEFRIFAEDDFKFLDRFYLNAGLHYSGFFVDGTYYSSLEPRFSASYPIGEKMALKGAYSRMKQYLHLLTHSSMGLPTDLWLPVTSRVKPQYSNQVTLGFVYHINNMFSLNIESYYKTLNQIYAYKEGTDYLSGDNSWESDIEMGNGTSRGLETMLRKNTGKLGGWISYTWSKTDRQFDEINDGEPFPYKYDRTHQANIVLRYDPHPRFSVNATWIYATGMAYTLSHDKYVSLFNLYDWNAPGNPSGFVDAIDHRNNRRMPAYHRLDASVSYHRKWEKIALTLNFSVYNLYNRFNPYLVYWDDEMSNQEQRQVKQVALFSVIPSLGARLVF